MLHYMKFEWPVSVKSIFNVMVNFIPTMENGFSIDCFIVLSTDDQLAITGARLVITLLKPICMFGLFLLVNIIYTKIKNRKR